MNFDERVDRFIASKRVQLDRRLLKRKLEQARPGARSILIPLVEAQRIYNVLNKEDKA